MGKRKGTVGQTMIYKKQTTQTTEKTQDWETRTNNRGWTQVHRKGQTVPALLVTPNTSNVSQLNINSMPTKPRAIILNMCNG